MFDSSCKLNVLKLTFAFAFKKETLLPLAPPLPSRAAWQMVLQLSQHTSLALHQGSLLSKL